MAQWRLQMGVKWTCDPGLWDVDVAGSNPVTPTIDFTGVFSLLTTQILSLVTTVLGLVTDLVTTSTIDYQRTNGRHFLDLGWNWITRLRRNRSDSTGWGVRA